MYIFPQNYNFKNKFLGFIDYSTLIFIIIWCAFILFIFKFFHINLTIKIFIFISLTLPVLIISIVGFNHENIIYVFYYIFKFYKNKRIYLYKK